MLCMSDDTFIKKVSQESLLEGLHMRGWFEHFGTEDEHQKCTFPYTLGKKENLSIAQWI